MNIIHPLIFTLIHFDDFAETTLLDPDSTVVHQARPNNLTGR